MCALLVKMRLPMCVYRAQVYVCVFTFLLHSHFLLWRLSHSEWHLFRACAGAKRVALINVNVTHACGRAGFGPALTGQPAGMSTLPRRLLLWLYAFNALLTINRFLMKCFIAF